MTIEHEISERYSRLPSSNFAKILKIAVEDKDVISLGPGEPDFTTPEHIRDAAIMAIDKGFTHYSPPGGRTETKETIAKKLKKDNRINVSPEEIIVTCGSQEALFLATQSLIDPGEKMIVPNPGFLAFIPMVETLTGIPEPIPLREKNGFEFDPDELEKLIDRRTRVILINSPSNPTGRMLKRKTLEKLADIAIQHDLVIFSDEAYEKLTYDNRKHISIGSLNGMKDRVITFQSFSKSYAMPGFRIGYAAGPKDIIQAMTRLHIYTTVCAPTLSQLTAIEALTGNQSCVKEMRTQYNRRRKLIIKRLKEIPDINCLQPEGAFYAFPNISKLGSSVEVANLFLKKAKVLVVPGTEFGKYGEGYVRMSYATSYEKIEEAMDRIEKVVKNR
ncbi:MAG: aminotransferase class I/II-fold pyridoxal phosphate-dependent enzyme [Candidatus Aenigmarchaeota archaeon]|nr:aminotransferase class I/II-fold pyridoxal phosphate-dependent enzyme [Candidatus Aenigmarchaeota archaeon]